MKPFLTFDGATPSDPAVGHWFDAPPHELHAIARRWFAEMTGCGPDVLELLHDGCPVACVADAPFGYVDVFKTHVNVGFFHGDALHDPARLLQGTGRFMRHVKLRPGSALDEAALKALIRAAHDDIGARLAERDAERRAAAGGKPQLAKADGDAPVQADTAALPGWGRS